MLSDKGWSRGSFAIGLCGKPLASHLASDGLTGGVILLVTSHDCNGVCVVIVVLMRGVVW